MSAPRTTSRRPSDAASASHSPHDKRHPYLRRPAAAEFLGVSPGTMARWASAGAGPSYHRIGGKVVVYAIDELVRFANLDVVQTSGRAA